MKGLEELTIGTGLENEWFKTGVWPRYSKVNFYYTIAIARECDDHDTEVFESIVMLDKGGIEAAMAYATNLCWQLNTLEHGTEPAWFFRVKKVEVHETCGFDHSCLNEIYAENERFEAEDDAEWRRALSEFGNLSPEDKERRFRLYGSKLRAVTVPPDLNN